MSRPAPRLEALSSQKRTIPSRQKCFVIVQKMIRTSLKNVALCCKKVDPGHSSKQNHPCRQTSSFLYNFMLLNLCKEYADTGYSTHKYTEYRNNYQYLVKIRCSCRFTLLVKTDILACQTFLWWLTDPRDMQVQAATGCSYQLIFLKDKSATVASLLLMTDKPPLSLSSHRLSVLGVMIMVLKDSWAFGRVNLGCLVP